MMKWKSLAVLGLVFGMSGMTWGLAQQRQEPHAQRRAF